MLAPDDDVGSLAALKFSLASDIVELVVLTGDEAFLQTMRDAAGSARRLWHVPSGDKVSDLLVAGGVGIVILDVQALVGPTLEFVAQIKRQFPDLVVVVAGNRDDETQLASLISAGSIYRFIHKPLSPARARLFTEAAVRKYDDQRSRASALPLQARKPGLGRGTLIGAAVGVLAAMAVLLWALHPNAVNEGAHLPVAPSPAISADSLLLSRAASAMSANRLTSPPGDNALELYRQAEALKPGDPQAIAGIAEVHERLSARIESALLEEHLDEAAQAIDNARKAGIDNARLTFLSAQLSKARDQLKAAQTLLHAKSDLPDTQPLNVLPAAAAGAGARSEAPAPIETEQTVPIEPAAPAASTALVQIETPPMTPAAVDTVDGAAAQVHITPSAQLTLLKTVQPIYPKKAEAGNLQGWVELDFTVGERGEVKDLAIHASSMPGIFDEAAIKAVAQWRYQPIMKDGKPSSARTRVRIRFEDVPPTSVRPRG